MNTFATVLCTLIYSALLLWGFAVGLRLLYQGYRSPATLLNPLFGNRNALRLFAIHLAVVSADLFLIGPWAIAHKSELWYWGGRIALFTSSMPLAAYLNRNSQSFGRLIGRWVTGRNLFEYAVHIAVAALPTNWFAYSVLLWWLVGYRYLDVGPRRGLQRLYNTPQKRAARPWAPRLNWLVITALYVASLLAVWNGLIAYAQVPPTSRPVHVPARWEVATVVGGNLALVLLTWGATRRYTRSLERQARSETPAPAGS